MSSKAKAPSPQPAIHLHQAGKVYHLYQRPRDRLIELLPGVKPRGRHHTALSPIDLQVGHGEVVGLVGRNGAGKSTLLQLICGTLAPSTGQVQVNGRIAALLELGAGFNPDFTGRDNVFMNGAILGLSHAQIAERFDEIHAFSEIGDAIDQPVKTYSSGMFVRLAFAVAVCVEPDILVIDEALSVGDGAFARRSFDRIMALKEAGKTILFCSHNTYQIEAICNRALWLHQGEVKAEGQPAEVVARYEQFLHSSEASLSSHSLAALSKPSTAAPEQQPRLKTVEIHLDNQLASLGETPQGYCDISTLSIHVTWEGGLTLPTPSLAVTLHAADGRMVASAGSHIDQHPLRQTPEGGEATLEFPKLPLLKGEYWVEVYLMCEQGVLFYDQQVPAARFSMNAPDRPLEQGLVHLPRRWHELERTPA